MGFFDMFGGSVVSGITDIAKEMIETDKESAEAKALMVKTLDPNGAMRRDISNKVSSMYVIYIILVMILTLLQSFDIGSTEGVKLAIVNLTDLFVPITTMFTAIVSASFGVNVSNNFKDKK